MAVAGLILAAGESARMGEPKALLDWGGQPLLEAQIEALTAADCDPVIVVLGHEAAWLRERIAWPPTCRIVENREYQQGRASSVRRGAEAIPDDSEAVVVVSVDQPCRKETVRRLIDALREGDALIAVPQHEHRHGHPTIYSRTLLEALRHVQEAGQGLRAVQTAQRAKTVFVAVPDPLVLLNLNTSEDYTAARAARETANG